MNIIIITSYSEGSTYTITTQSTKHNKLKNNAEQFCNGKSTVCVN